jgi:hypothetical protein
LESVCWGNSTVGSNPTLSAIHSCSENILGYFQPEWYRASMLHRKVYRLFLADNQWASVTSTSGDAFEGGVVLRGSYVHDGAASTIAGYVFPYNASIGPGCGGIFIYSSYKFTEELTSFTRFDYLAG